MFSACEVVKQNVNIESVLRHYEFKHIRKSSNQIRCACAIHGGDNVTSFVADTNKNLYYCHTNCGGGDVIDLTMNMEQISFSEAINFLAKMFNIDIQDLQTTEEKNKVTEDTKQWIEMMRRIYAKKSTVEYDIELLGALYPINKYRHFTKETLEYFNIRYCTNNSRIIVPIYFKHILVGVTMRRTNNHPSKWLHTPTGLLTSDYLYNYDNITLNEPLIVVEGVWDVLSYWQAGYENVVATFGTNLSSEQEKLLLQSTYKVILSYDTDKAGINGTRKIIERLRNKVNLSIAKIPNGKDAGEMREVELIRAMQNKMTIGEWS